MSKLSAKLTTQFVMLLLIGAASLLVVGGAGVWGLGQTRSAADKIYSDQLRTLGETSTVDQELDDTYEQAQALLLTDDPLVKQNLTNEVLQTDAPDVEVALHSLQRIHAGDPPKQLELVHRLVRGWAQFMALWTPQALLAPAPDVSAVAGQLDAVFGPLEGVTDTLVSIEQHEAAVDHETADNAYRTSVVLIAVVASGAMLFGFLYVVFIARRVLPRALAPEEDQAEFAEAMQLAGGQSQAQGLLVRHLQRAIPHSQVVVFNRDKTTDRLESLNALPAGSPIGAALDEANGATCTAIRSARVYTSERGCDQLLPCDLCGACPGTSICSPLTVGGEIVGSILVTRDTALDADDGRRIRDSILQATPVLANLRNLAKAEMQAATDALTNLPNKRSVQMTVTRMVAQADRTATSLALLSLDIDHFKLINDTYGHGRGDAVLTAVGSVLRGNLRASDFAGRNGGEEFLVLLPSTTIEDAVIVADKIREGLDKIRVANVDTRITASIGVASFPVHATDGDALERSADRALYRAKANGRDRVEVAPVTDAAGVGGR